MTPTEYAPLKNPKMFDLAEVYTNQCESLLQSSPILFHGVNKSGSLAFAKVLHTAYVKSGNDHRFMCRYMQMPASKDEAFKQFREKLDLNPILIDHGLFGREEDYPRTKVVTILRDPLRRVISIYFWLSSHHPEKILGRDLLSWAAQDWRSYSQVRQFAYDHRNSRTAHAIDQKPIGELIATAECKFHSKVAWFGICELFEESIISLATELGLRTIPVWEDDKRNIAKPKFNTLPKNLERALTEILSYDIAFYEIKKQEFIRNMRKTPLSAFVQKYRAMVQQSR